MPIVLKHLEKGQESHDTDLILRVLEPVHDLFPGTRIRVEPWRKGLGMEDLKSEHVLVLYGSVPEPALRCIRWAIHQRYRTDDIFAAKLHLRNEILGVDEKRSKRKSWTRERRRPK
jgi:hypothetical protein